MLSKRSTAEQKAKVLPFIESIVPIDDNIETHLNKTNANNTNGITHEMQKNGTNQTSVQLLFE